MNLTDLQSLTKPYADARGQLAAVVTELNDCIESLKRKKLPIIKELVARAAEREGNLRAGITSAPQLFEQPRTVIFHGIKIGLQKGKGGIEFDDPGKVVDLIRKNFTEEEAEALIRTIEEPDKKMLALMPVADLKRIGCTVGNTADEVVIRPTDTGVDKIVNALLKAAVETKAESRNGES
jgi:hypothetical protein